MPRREVNSPYSLSLWERGKIRSGVALCLPPHSKSFPHCQQPRIPVPLVSHVLNVT
jgi:hypothetical protein